MDLNFNSVLNIQTPKRCPAFKISKKHQTTIMKVYVFIQIQYKSLLHKPRVYDQHIELI